MLDLLRAAPEVGARVVTVSPDASSSTTLGGWVTEVGRWSVMGGQHIELGIAETDLIGVLGELGATGSPW